MSLSVWGGGEVAKKEKRVLPYWCPTVVLWMSLGECVEWVQVRAVSADFQRRRLTAPLASRHDAARTQQSECSVTKCDLRISLGLRRQHRNHDGIPVNTHTMRTKEGAHIHTTVNLANLSGGAHSPSFRCWEKWRAFLGCVPP